MSTHVCSVLSIDFVKKSGFECCFWSTQCIETQARTSDNVKTWVFNSLIVQWWSLIDNVVWCNIFSSIRAVFTELEKAMFTGAIFVPMSTIITLGPYIHSKQSETFHAKCNLKVNCENKMSLISKSDCMSVTDLKHALGHLCHLVDVCSKLHKDFYDHFFNVPDQLVASDWKTTKT